MSRVVILNSFARAVVHERRGKHPVYIFVYDGKKANKMNSSAWDRARKLADCNKCVCMTCVTRLAVGLEPQECLLRTDRIC